jgi:hypothetical protein
MFRQKKLITALVLFAFHLAAAAPIRAQDGHKSHVPVPLPADVDPVKLFQERIQQARMPADVADMVKQFTANRGTGTAEEQIRKLLDENPQFRDMLFNPAMKDQAHDLIGKAIRMTKLPPGITPKLIQDQLDALRQGEPIGVSIPQSFTPRTVNRPTLDPAEQARKRELVNQMAQWAERFPRDKLPESVRNSPALMDLFQRLAESVTDALRNPDGADGLDALAKLESRFQTVRDWLPKEMPAALKSLHLPDLSRFSANVHVPHFDANAPSLPSAPRFNGFEPEARPVFNAMLAGIGVVIVCVMLWRLFGGRLSPTVGGNRVLGPWPLDPSRVATRAELIQAFEYLSLLHCGEPARAWHHRAIADCLGGNEADRRDAAARLAELYEQARYAPAAGGEPDWSAARGPLSFLAGAG